MSAIHQEPHPPNPCCTCRWCAEARARERQRAAFDAKVRTHGYVDRVTNMRIYDPDRLTRIDGVPARVAAVDPERNEGGA